MRVGVRYDENASRRARWIISRAPIDSDRWTVVGHFGTERDAQQFARGFKLGANHAADPAPTPIDDRAHNALRLVKLARDEYKRECQSLRAQLRESVRRRVAA